MVQVTGTSGNIAEVNDQLELVTRAINESELEHASAKLGSAWSWDSTELDIVAGETMLFIKNTGTTPLILDRLYVNGSNVICTWDVAIGSASTTPAGTAVTPVNLNPRFSGNTVEALAYSDETAVADASLVMRIKTAISDLKELSLDGIVLEKGHYIQVNQETESTSGSIQIIGHFENPD